MSKVRQKLAKARLMFLKENVSKSGKNMHMQFKYFELEDIVPAAIKIFDEVGLVTLTDFSDEVAVMRVFDTDDDESEGIMFAVKNKEVPPIFNKDGVEVTNPLQRLGSSITYLRRYLYMMVLDICEHDEIDANLKEPTEEPKATKSKKAPVKVKKAPATAQDREKVTKELTAEEPATEEAIEQIKSMLKELRMKDESKDEFIQKIMVKTKGLTTLNMNVAQELVKNISKMLEEYK